METKNAHSKLKYKYTFGQVLQALEGILIILSCYITFFLKPLRDRWGMKKELVHRYYPGDNFVANPKSQFTHAIKINAPAEYVWPWIAQIGQGRGGFYSYELLEKIAGLDIINSDKILPEYQQPKIGDVIPFSSEDGYPLVICKPGKHMAIEVWHDLESDKRFDTRISKPSKYLHLTWLWSVKEIDNNQALFISRNRVDFSTSWKTKLIFGLLAEPIVFAMDRKMCLGIKERAEALFKQNKESHLLYS